MRMDTRDILNRNVTTDHMVTLRQKKLVINIPNNVLIIRETS